MLETRKQPVQKLSTCTLNLLDMPDVDTAMRSATRHGPECIQDYISGLEPTTVKK